MERLEPSSLKSKHSGEPTATFSSGSSEERKKPEQQQQYSVLIQENKNITLQRVFKNFLLLDPSKRREYVSLSRNEGYSARL